MRPIVYSIDKAFEQKESHISTVIKNLSFLDDYQHMSRGGAFGCCIFTEDRDLCDMLSIVLPDSFFADILSVPVLRCNMKAELHKEICFHFDTSLFFVNFSQKTQITLMLFKKIKKVKTKAVNIFSRCCRSSFLKVTRFRFVQTVVLIQLYAHVAGCRLWIVLLLN